MMRVSVRRSKWSLISLLVLLIAPGAGAHTLGEGYIFLTVDEDSIEGRVELTLSALDSVLQLDGDGDGRISDEELDGGADRAKDYVFGRIGLGHGDDWYTFEPGDVTVGNFPLGRYGIFHFNVADVTEVPQILQIKYDLLFDTEPKHRGFVLVEWNALTGEENLHEAISLVMTPDTTVQPLDLMNATGATGLLAFIKHGVWHIWIGADHIAFLLTLLLQSVLLCNGKAWEPAEGFRPAFISVAKIVTLFTVAHTITLSMAALEIVSLPPRFVESVIAASIVAAAVLNFYPPFAGYLYHSIFIFGLFHGFGFASVLGHLTTQSGSLVYSLLGFNLGVELGQLAVVCVVFPILFFIRSKGFYQPFVLKVGSALTGFVALIWLIERSFDVGPFLGF